MAFIGADKYPFLTDKQLNKSISQFINTITRNEMVVSEYADRVLKVEKLKSQLME